MCIRWYVFRDERRTGPFSWEQLLEKAVEGDIQPDDLVWSEETAGWVQGRDVIGLFPEEPSSPPLPPPPEKPAGTFRKQALGDGGPLSVGQFLLMLVVFSIPVLNLVMFLIWSFSPNAGTVRRNLARAMLIWGLVITAALIAIWTVWVMLAG